MCGGDEPEVDTSFQDWSMAEAERARREEDRRQGRIDTGMDKIAAIFEGGRTPGRMMGVKGGFDPKAKYFLGGERWRPTAPGGAPQPARETKEGRYYDAPGGGSYFESISDPGAWYMLPGGTWEGGYEAIDAPDLGAAGSRREQYRGVKGDLETRGPGKKYAGTKPLIKARREAMEDYYLPQLQDNFEDANEQLIYALSRAGLGTSTVANEKRSDLREGFRREKAGVFADIEGDLANTKSQINDSRSAIEAALRASGDTSAAADAALRSRRTFAQDAPELNPLTNTLLAFAQGIGSAQQGFQVGNIRRVAAGGGFQDQSRIVS